MVLYCPEAATGLRRVSIDIPFSASVSDGKITQQCQAIASVKLCFADASAVNSRKAVIRASIVTNVKCFCDEVITAGEEIENIERVETLVKTQTAQLSVCVKEKNTSLSDEHTIDNTQNASVDILKYCVETIADEYKIVGNKLVIRARACYSVLYRTGGDIKKLEYYKEFSQIIEFDDIDEGDSFEIVLMPSGVYFECPEPSQTQETKIISELHVLAQCVQNKTFTLKYIADAYSTSAKLNCETEKYCLCTQNSSSCINELLIKTIEIPNQIDNVISVTAHCYGSGINQDGMLRTTVYVSAIYKDLDERIMSSDRRFEVEVTPENIQFSDVSVSSKVAEIYSAVGSKGIDLRISVDFNITTSNYANIESVVGGTCDEIDDVNNGINSIVLRRAASKAVQKHNRYNNACQCVGTGTTTAWQRTAYTTCEIK
jgi:hypothetical protein